MANRTVAAPPADRSVTPSVQPRPADAAARLPWRRVVGGAAAQLSWRRVLGATALVVLVGLPLGLQIELVYARRDLEQTRSIGRAARADVRSQRSLVAASELTLTGVRADEAAAATDVEAARTRLAATGVKEHEIVSTLDETERRLEDVEAQRIMAEAMLRQQELDLPTAKECVLEANRGLSRGGPVAPCSVTWLAATEVG